MLAVVGAAANSSSVIYPGTSVALHGLKGKSLEDCPGSTAERLTYCLSDFLVESERAYVIPTYSLEC